ncbi:AEC family transporter [Paenibacillus borealis]|uniref:Membrane protein n=1 Tax=Paenibacillus borealis TaxID=160799 RepID=A0A089LH59_PAEBO|nr:AEC family transporter [Paenibacillus borealis]AIQ60856.1 membrane protein [Paenibacillus borealis]
MEFVLIILPVFLIMGAGFLGQKLLKLEIRSISTMALYLMMPFLTFNTFYTNEINIDYAYMFLFNILLILVLVIVTVVVGKAIKADKSSMSAMLLGTAFPNMGNYGAPVILFAFGATAFNYAVITMVIQTLLINTIGIFIAAYGSEQPTSVKQALLSVVKMPVLYGVLLGVVFQVMPITLPGAIMDGIELIGSASIPTITLLLGMQLAQMKAQQFEFKYVSSITLIRMVVSPLVMAVLVSLMPVSPMIRNVFILLAAMPIAANTTLLALQFNTRPNLVSYITLVTTLVSLLTVPITLYLLG